MYCGCSCIEVRCKECWEEIAKIECSSSRCSVAFRTRWETCGECDYQLGNI